MKKGTMNLTHVERSIYKTSFLKVVTYAISIKLSGENDNEAMMGYWKFLINEGYNVSSKSENKDISLEGTKSDIRIFCRRNLLLIFVQEQAYKNYDLFKGQLFRIINAYLEAMKAESISLIYMMKANEYDLNRKAEGMENVSIEDFRNVICSKLFIEQAEDGKVSGEIDGITLIAQSMTKSDNEVHNLNISISGMEIVPIAVASLEKHVDKMNGAIYDMWNAVISDDMKQLMNK